VYTVTLILIFNSPRGYITPEAGSNLHMTFSGSFFCCHLK
jgi:hypothetical protein